MGERIPFDRTQPFNQLPLLPPPEGEVITIPILTKLAGANRLLGKLEGISARLPNPNVLINTISLQEARSSSEIENIFTTDDELYKALTDRIREENANPATKEVLRYREALWAGVNDIKEQKQFSRDAIIKIFQQIKQSREGIRPPQSRTVIVKRGSGLTDGEVIYTPPRGEGIIEEKLNNLITYLNNDDEYPHDPLLKLAVTHSQFESIHPFTDGNGRTGRILNILLLVQKHLLTHPVLYLSKYIIQNKEEYYFQLGRVNQSQNWENWILFMLTAIEQTAGYTIMLIESIMDQMNETYAYTRKKLPFMNKDIMEALFTQPYIRRETIARITGTRSRTTSTKYMQDLCKLGVLSTKKEGREVFYINNDLLNILSGNNLI